MQEAAGHAAVAPTLTLSCALLPLEGVLASGKLSPHAHRPQTVTFNCLLSPTWSVLWLNKVQAAVTGPSGMLVS